MKQVYELDHDFVCIKRQHKPDFKEAFSKALDNYIDGDWVNAQSNLSNALILNPIDGPLRWLTDYLEGHKNLAPETWRGCRDLDQKQSEAHDMGNPKNDDGHTIDQDANPDVTSADATDLNSPGSASR